MEIVMEYHSEGVFIQYDKDNNTVTVAGDTTDTPMYLNHVKRVWENFGLPFDENEKLLVKKGHTLNLVNIEL